MEYAKDKVLQIGYDTKLNRLEIKEDSWIKRFNRNINRHKLLTTAIIAFFMFSIMNIVMLYCFMKILQNI